MEPILQTAVIRPTRSAAPRLPALDALRAAAVLLVLGRHGPQIMPGTAPDWIVWLAGVARTGGWMGVDLFFVLSGFLVCGLLFREHARTGELHIGRFLARRALRIYPAFYCMFAGTLLLGTCLGRGLPGWPSLLAEAFFVQNYFPGVFPQTWSLAVEEHFYLLLPFSLLLIRSSKERPFANLPKVCLLIVLLALGARLLTAELLTDELQPFQARTQLFPTHLRVDSLCFGVWLAWLHQYHRAALEKFVVSHRFKLLGGGLLLCIPAFVLSLDRSPFITTYGLTMLAAAAGCLLLFCLSCQRAPRFITAVGAQSYSIYLWHMTLLRFGFPLLPPQLDPLSRLALFFAASICLGMLMARLTEVPFLALRERWWPAAAKTEPFPLRAMLH